MSTAEESLNSEDALCLRIGRIARAHVFLDNVLRNLHSTLLSPTQGVYLTENITSTDRLVTDCRTMVTHAPVHPAVREAGLDALTAAQVVNRERNRVVHDMWLRESLEETDDPLWQRSRIDKRLTGSEPPRAQELADVDKVRHDLETATIRISGLVKALFFLLPTVSRGLPPAGADYWIAVAAGKFDRAEDGRFHVHGYEAPLHTGFQSPGHGGQ